VLEPEQWMFQTDLKSLTFIRNFTDFSSPCPPRVEGRCSVGKNLYGYKKLSQIFTTCTINYKNNLRDASFLRKKL
jgi:hypothetical protein